MRAEQAGADVEQLFPGLIYRMLKPKVVLLIFVSGKIVLTGAKVRGEPDSRVGGRCTPPLT